MRPASAPSSLAAWHFSMVVRVQFVPTPAVTMTWPEAAFTAISMHSAHSSDVRVGVSPVVPQGTSPATLALT